MPVRSAALQFLNWDTQAGIVYKSGGLVMGGGLEPDSGVDIRYGSGNQSSPFAGPVGFPGRAEMAINKDSKALIQYALRGAGSLTAMKFHGGTDEVGFLHANAYINRLVLSGGINEPASAAIEWIALTETEAAGSAMVALGGNLLPFGGASVTVDGNPYKCQRWEITVENGITPYYSLDAKAANSKRLPDGLTVGAERVSLAVDSLLKQTWTPGEDVPISTIDVVIIYTDGVDTLTLTLTNVTRRGSRRTPIVTESNLMVWGYEFIGPAGALVIT